MAQYRGSSPFLVSPTPIRPLSPASSPTRDRPEEKKQPVQHLEAEPVCDESEMELGQEIFAILQGSPRSCSVYSSSQHQGAEMKPPSRNQNPLIKDQQFRVSAHVDRDVITSSLSAAMCGDLMRGNRFVQAPEVVVGS